MIGYKITVGIGFDQFSWEVFTWITACENLEAAMRRAESFAAMALKEAGGSTIESIKVERKD